MDYVELARQKALKYGLDPTLFVRQIQAESSFNPNAVSPKGAIGLGQIMPATAKELGINPEDPDQNLDGAARYMRQQLDTFGDYPLALAAYNAGAGNVRKAGGIPNFTETQNYVSKIMGTGGSAMNANPMSTGGLLAASQAIEEEYKKEQADKPLFQRDSFKDMAGDMAILFNSMRMEPDDNIVKAVSSIKAERTERGARNKTVELMKRAGRDDLAAAASSGVLTAKEAYATMLSDAAKIRERQASMTDAMTLAKYEAGLKAPKGYQYQQLAKDLLSQGLASTEKEALQMALSQTKTSPTVSVSYGDKGGPPKAFEKVDDEFAKEAVQWSSGGAADAMKNLTQIRDVITDINMAVREGRTPSGPLVGVQNDLVQSFINPEATDIRNRVQEVVQRNLREILGAQFTQAEGLALIERAYNQRLAPEQNLRRLNALLEQMATAATAKQQMYEYFMDKGTLFGYRAEDTLPTLDELHGVMDMFDRQQGVSTSDLRPKPTTATSNISKADVIVGIDK